METLLMIIDGKKVVTYGLSIALLASLLFLGVAVFQIYATVAPFPIFPKVPQVSVTMNGDTWLNGTYLPLYGNIGDNLVPVTVSNLGDTPFTFSFVPHAPEGWDFNTQFVTATVEPHSEVNGTLVVTVPDSNYLDFNWICEIHVWSVT
jgi:hypothetical protein